MKRNIKLLLIVIILGIIAFLFYKFVFTKTINSPKEDFSKVRSYIKDIYGETFLIPEFDDINEADETWLWENINQYVWNHDDEYHEQNAQEYGYTYDEVSKIVKILYGDNLKKKFPKSSVSMRYNAYRDLYGPTSFAIPNYYDYRIESIQKNENTYTVSLYDFTISLEKFYGNDESDDYFEIFNNYEYLLCNEDAEPIIKVKSLNDDDFKNILDNKNRLSHKILTIEYDELTNLFYIKSCKYKETKDSEILATVYNKMQNTFEIDSIDYHQDDIYTQDEIIVNNFNELAQIYTENALPTYKEEMNLFVFKDNGEVYITAGDIEIRYYISKIEFKDIEKTENKITCTAIRTFRESFNPSDEEYNQTYQKEDKFTIVNIDGIWYVDEFSYNN